MEIRLCKILYLSVLLTMPMIYTPFAHADSSDKMKYHISILELMESYYRIIESTHSISSNAEKSAILQIHRIQKYYKEIDEHASAKDFLREMLQKTNNPAIRNAVYLMLGDNLEETGRSQEAIKLLRKGLQENLEVTN